MKRNLDCLALKIGNFINKKSEKDFNPQISGYIVIGVVVLLGGIIIGQCNLNLGQSIGNGFAYLIDREGYYMDQAEIAMQCEDYLKAQQIYQEWAAKDSVKANLKLGEFYLKSHYSIYSDLDKARKYLQKAIDLGSPYAKLVFAKNLRLDDDKAKAYLESGFQAILKLAQDGNLDAILSVSECYLKGPEVKPDAFEASQWLKKAVAKKYAPAQYKFGMMYYNGEGMPRDRQMASKYFTMAAEQNYIPAVVKLADYYDDENDKEETFKYCSIATQLGHIPSQGMLGDLYQEGDGVEKDLEQAAKCYFLSASRGNPEYQYKYAECLAEGEGIEKNWEQAVAWYRKSARNGCGKAQGKLENRGISW